MTRAALRRRLTQVAALGCIICGSPACIHHVPPSGRRPDDDTSVRRDDRYVLPLCAKHHQTGGHGVALHAGVATWEQVHGEQAWWLEKVDKMLAAERERRG